MDRLPLALNELPFCQSPDPKDQLYYPNTSLQSTPSSWPPATYSMDLGDARSDPATPDGQDGTFYPESATLSGGSGSMGYFHGKSLSNASSMGGSPRTFSDDAAAQFATIDASQPHHNVFRQQNPRLSDQRHHPSSYAARTQMQMNPHGPPLAHHPPLNPYGEHSMAQQAPSNFMRLSGVPVDGSNDRGHPGNPAHYHFAFNGMEVPPPSPSTPVGNWNHLMHNNNHHVYPQVQGVPVLPPSAYGPLGMPSNLAATLGHGPSLFTNFSIAQIQQCLGFRDASSLTNAPNSNSALAYGMNMSGPGMPHGNLEASQLGLSMSGPGAPANTRPQSQSTMSTPSLAGNSPILPWSPSFESVSHGTGSIVGSISYPVPTVRGPPTPPQLPSDVMPPKRVPATAKPPPIPPAAKPCHHSRGTNASVSSMRSGESVSPGPMPLSPAPTSIPLRVRVNALPRDKRTLFERGAGELWNPRSPKEDHEDGLDRSQAMLLEDLCALIGSEQLRNQIEIPDDLVEPILRTILLPRADAHKGSRGGAAGHLCLWAGCGKTIKRLDHSRNHIREHVRSKPHTCGGQGSKGCGQMFLRMDDLKRHQKSHCSVLRSGPGRRPRSIRGTRRDTDEEEEERDSEDSASLNGGDDDDYRPIHARAQPSVASSSSTSATRELASRLRSQRQRAARYVVGDESTEESDSGNQERGIGRLHTSNVRRAVESPVENPCEGEEGDDGSGDCVGSQKVRLAYSTLMASCSSQLITSSIGCFLLSLLFALGAWIEGCIRWCVLVCWGRPCGETLRMMLTA